MTRRIKNTALRCLQQKALTEQSFSQFALSNRANVFNAEGKITLDTPEMMQALTYYRDLAANTMPGSNDIMEVKDAFMNGTAPMAIYSTYILPAVIKEGDPKNVGFVVPTEKNSAVYGMLTSLTITAGQRPKRRKRQKNLSPLWNRRTTLPTG